MRLCAIEWGEEWTRPSQAAAEKATLGVVLGDGGNGLERQYGGQRGEGNLRGKDPFGGGERRHSAAWLQFLQFRSFSWTRMNCITTYVRKDVEVVSRRSHW